jgi:hypothetical protein
MKAYGSGCIDRIFVLTSMLHPHSPAKEKEPDKEKIKET